MSVASARVRIAAARAKNIRNALKQSVDVDALIDKWLREFGDSEPVSTERMRAWVRRNAETRTEALEAALRLVYGDGWALGERIALSRLASAYGVKAPSQQDLARAAVTNWNTWKPGNAAAANLLKPKSGLKRLLNARGITIRNVNNTTMDRIGTALADALRRGESQRQAGKRVLEVLRRDAVRAVDGLLTDPQRALMIANTEMARATVEASRDSYRDAGAEMVEYLTADPCDDCMENELVSPISIDDEWPMGDPPVHPNCMCDIAPYIPETKEASAKVFGSEAALAFQRLETMPAPLGTDEPEASVESPWRTMPRPVFAEDAFDDAEVTHVALEELVGVEPFLSRNRVRKFIRILDGRKASFVTFAFVLQRGSDKVIVDGEHRLMALWLLGFDEVPVWLAKESS